MRQICPNCLKSVDVPESAAGGEYDCPACGKPFPVPKGYTPAVLVPPARDAAPDAARPGGNAPGSAGDRPSPPPGFVPPAAPPPAGAHAPGPPTYAGPLRSHGVPLDPRVMAWLPAACLTVCLVLTFFPWVGAYPGGYRVCSQNPWEAGVRDVNFPATAVPEAVQKAEPELRALAPINLFMLLYGILLVVTVLLAWLERVFHTVPDVTTLPGPLAWLPRVWPHRFALLLGLTGLLLFLVGFQVWRGFGLETAVERYATNLHATEVEAADTNAKKQIAQIGIGMDAARFAVQPTTVRDLAVAAHVVAVLGVLARVWLTRRGPKPPPRLALEY